MDIALRNALDGLRRAGAKGLPDTYSVEQAAGGNRWQGKKQDGSRWYLVKHKPGSYNAEY